MFALAEGSTWFANMPLGQPFGGLALFAPSVVLYEPLLTSSAMAAIGAMASTKSTIHLFIRHSRFNLENMPSFLDLTGKRFGRLSVLSRATNAPCGHVRWNCRCDCGSKPVVTGMGLRSGQTKSCGCLRSEIVSRVTKKRNRVHGHSVRGKRSKAYIAWVNMIQRCTNPNATKYAEYGGRGIKVCSRWRKSFEAFQADMGPPPTPNHSIDRKNNDGDYKPSNCRWAIEETQMNNRSKNRILECGGRSMTLEQWARETEIPHRTIGNRIDRLGWPLSDALSIRPSPLARNKR